MAKYSANGYQYETSPRKIQPEYVPQKKKNNKKVSNVKQKNNYSNSNKNVNNKSSNAKIILSIGIIFAILFAISYRNGLIAQKYSEIKNLKTDLTEIEKDNKQLEVNIEEKTNLSTIEEKATNELGMKKLDDSQTVYVSLDKQDYIESSVDQIKLEEENVFTKIINKIKDIF